MNKIWKPRPNPIRKMSKITRKLKAVLKMSLNLRKREEVRHHYPFYFITIWCLACLVFSSTYMRMKIPK